MRAFLIILALLFSGCTTMKPSVAQYSIEIDELNINPSANGCKERSLKISKAFSKGSLSSHRMEYMEPGSIVFSYSQSQWQELPSVMIESILLKSIREAGLFKSVHPSRSRINSNFILETNIEEFMQYFSKDLNESHIRVSLNLSLIDIQENSVVKSKTFSSEVKANSPDADGGVEAFRAALREIATQNIAWLEGACR